MKRVTVVVAILIKLIILNFTAYSQAASRRGRRGGVKRWIVMEAWQWLIKEMKP